MPFRVVNRSPRDGMSSGTRRKVLVYATGPLGDRLAGPEIRALQHADALRSDYEVTLMAQRPDRTERDGFPVVSWSRDKLIREAIRNDVIVSPCLAPYLMISKKLFGFVAVSDKYDPYEVELVAIDNERHERELRLHSLALTIDLRCADVVLCAAEQQRQNLIAAATKLNLGPGAAPPEPVVVPFGIPDPPPQSGRRPLRERFAQIRDDDTVVLWWGAVWKWLDAETPIRAFARLADSRPDVKLVITAGAPPSANNQRFEAVNDARELARELGLLDRNVLFLDEWIPYEDRWDYLWEANIGLTLHRFSAEAALAARSRYVDYLSAGLPCILGRGDQTASEFESAGFATLVDHPEPAELAELIAALAADRTQLNAAAAAGRQLAAERHISTAAEKLRAAVAAATNIERSSDIRGGSLTLAGTAGFYYAHKLAHRVLA